MVYRVNAHSESNKMTASNLAVVFAPTIMRSPHESDEIQDLPSQRKIIEILIKHTPEIFETT